MSPGSTVIIELTNSKAMPQDILVGRLVTPLWGDRWVPMTVVNPTNTVITLKINCKIADVFPCIASEDFSGPTRYCLRKAGQMSHVIPALLITLTKVC